MLQKPYRLLCYRRDREQCPKIDKIVQSLIHLDATLEGYSSRSKQSRNLELEVLRVSRIDQRSHPLLEVYMWDTSTSDYTCHPSIHYILYMCHESGYVLKMGSV